MSNKKGRSHKKEPFFEVDNEPNSQLELDNLSYRKRTKKSRRKFMEFEGENNEANRKNESLNAEVKIKSNKRSKSKTKSENEKELKAITSANKKSKSRSKLKIRDNKMEHLSVRVKKNNDNTDNKDELLNEYLTSNDDARKMQDVDQTNSNSFLSLEDSFKSLSEFNNSNSSIFDSYINFNSESISNSDLDSNSESVSNDIDANSYSDLESRITDLNDPIPELNEYNIMEKNLNDELSSTYNSKKEKCELVKNEALNVQSNENNNAIDDYESFFDEIMEEKNTIKGQIKNGRNKIVQDNTQIDETILNNYTDSNSRNDSGKFNDTNIDDKARNNDMNDDSLDYQVINIKDEVKLNEYTEHSKIENNTEALCSTSVHEHNPNSKGDVSTFDKRELLDDQDNFNFSNSINKAEVNSSTKFSKRKLLYSFANSVWDYMKPVSLDELEKEQNELSKANNTLKNDTSLVEDEEHSEVKNVAKNGQEHDNDDVIRDDCNEISRKDDSNTIAINYEMKSKSQDNIMENIISDSCENNEILEDKEITGISNSNLSTPIRKSKRQIIYKFANSIWDYMKPTSLDELQNEESKDTFDEMNSNIDVNNNSKSDNVVSNNTQSSGNMIKNLIFGSNIESDISDTEFLIGDEDQSHLEVENQKKDEIHVINDDFSNLSVVSDKFNSELNHDILQNRDKTEDNNDEQEQINVKNLSEKVDSIYNQFDSNNILSEEINDHDLTNLWGNSDLGFDCYSDNNNNNLNVIFNDGIDENIHNQTVTNSDFLVNTLDSNYDTRVIEDFKSFNEGDTNDDYLKFSIIPDNELNNDKHNCSFQINNQQDNNNSSSFNYLDSLLLSPIKEESYSDDENRNTDIRDIEESNNYNQESPLFISLSTDQFTDEKLYLDDCINKNCINFDLDINHTEDEKYNKKALDENMVNGNNNNEGCDNRNEEEYIFDNMDSYSNQLQLSSSHSSSTSSFSKETINSKLIFSGNGLNSKKINKNKQFNRLYKLNKKMRILTERMYKSITQIKEREERINNMIESRKRNIISLSKVGNIEIINNYSNSNIAGGKLGQYKVVLLEISGIKECKSCVHKYTCTDDIKFNMEEKAVKVDKETNTDDNYQIHGVKLVDKKLNKDDNINCDKSTKLDEIMRNEICKVLEKDELSLIESNKYANLKPNSSFVKNMESHSRVNLKPKLHHVASNDFIHLNQCYVHEKEITQSNYANDKNGFIKREKYLKPTTNKYEIIKSVNTAVNQNNESKYYNQSKNIELLSHNNYNNNKTSIKNGIGNSYLNYFQEYNYCSYNCNNKKKFNSEYPESNSGSEYSSLEKLPKQGSEYYFYRYYNPKVPEIAHSYTKVVSRKSNNHYNTSACETANYLSRDPNDNKLVLNNKDSYTSCNSNNNYHNDPSNNKPCTNVNYNYRNYYNYN
ncbi:hypothetical protein FG379_001511 [Cryptosporidium bovis]|uniref:uncharacterized protein n=1 Tax=Cryptosporidium bovis TaxID=310047 RepID=UPI003519FF3D|nr:hypothetical protein FG379_001511 [Cryptosporidium bovis]